MTNKRRVTLIIVSVSIGTMLSAALVSFYRKGLGPDDYLLLGTNLFYSLVIIFAIGYFLVWRKKD
jgi:hypothetical protein